MGGTVIAEKLSLFFMLLRSFVIGTMGFAGFYISATHSEGTEVQRSGSEIKARPGKEARAPGQRPGHSPFPYLALGSNHQGHAGEEEEPAAAMAATARRPP